MFSRSQFGLRLTCPRAMRRAAPRVQALRGLRCLELGNVLATPGVGQFLAELGCEVILAQTRGLSFGNYMAGRANDRDYEVDSVLGDGSVIFETSRTGAPADATKLGDAAGQELKEKCGNDFEAFFGGDDIAPEPVSSTSGKKTDGLGGYVDS